MEELARGSLLKFCNVRIKNAPVGIVIFKINKLSRDIMIFDCNANRLIVNSNSANHSSL